MFCKSRAALNFNGHCFTSPFPSNLSDNNSNSGLFSFSFFFFRQTAAWKTPPSETGGVFNAAEFNYGSLIKTKLKNKHKTSHALFVFFFFMVKKKTDSHIFMNGSKSKWTFSELPCLVKTWSQVRLGWNSPARCRKLMCCGRSTRWSWVCSWKM